MVGPARIHKIIIRNLYLSLAEKLDWLNECETGSKRMACVDQRNSNQIHCTIKHITLFYIVGFVTVFLRSFRHIGLIESEGTFILPVVRVQSLRWLQRAGAEVSCT